MREIANSDFNVFRFFLLLCCILFLVTTTTTSIGSGEFFVGTTGSAFSASLLAWIIRQVYFTRSIIVVPDPPKKAD